MKPMAIFRAVLLVFGVVALVYQGITYTSHDTVIDIGPIHATADRQTTFPLPPIVGLPRWPVAWCCSSLAGRPAREAVAERPMDPEPRSAPRPARSPSDGHLFQRGVAAPVRHGSPPRRPLRTHLGNIRSIAVSSCSASRLT